jgi:hypothetical protein
MGVTEVILSMFTYINDHYLCKRLKTLHWNEMQKLPSSSDLALCFLENLNLTEGSFVLFWGRVSIVGEPGSSYAIEVDLLLRGQSLFNLIKGKYMYIQEALSSTYIQALFSSFGDLGWGLAVLSRSKSFLHILHVHSCESILKCIYTVVKFLSSKILLERTHLTSCILHIPVKE